MEDYNHRAIEPRWQQRWLEARLYAPDVRRATRPFYNLMMFPYPSAEGLHVGNVYTFSGADVYGRFKRMQGWDVFQPIGLDGFGIHSENYAIKVGEHPARVAARTRRRFYAQLQATGCGFAWEHRLETYDPAYYRWTQWLFVQLFRRGLAYRAAAPVNWCQSCRTVLADEQVIDGICERCGTTVVVRQLEQWFFRITAYADRLRDNLEQLDWSDKIKNAQRQWIGERGAGLHLRDWLISRQRYWGPPIPMVLCSVDGWVPVKEADLPVLLPEAEQYQPSADGRTPLGHDEAFLQATCPLCGAPARRSDEVSDTFLDSAWYFLRYPSADVHDRPWDPEITRRWLPVDMYIAGAEHAVLHLLYTRFITMTLYDMGHLEFEEPFRRLRAHGLLRKDGAKMSKSRGNVVAPDDYIRTAGADALRTYLLFTGPFDQGGDFQDRGLRGITRFLGRVWRLTWEAAGVAGRARDSTLAGALSDTVRKVTADADDLRFNTAIAALMRFVNVWDANRERAARDVPHVFLRLLAPFAPHLTEELWVAALRESPSIHASSWPQSDAQCRQGTTAIIAILVNGRVRDHIEVPFAATEEDVIARALQRPAVRRLVVGDPARAVYVPGRVLNIVARA
ncbi:MAG TPA: class I tRNA ligase family protein [bacterium]|nr:class I tRNA ligase family protein [bacterium]